MESAAFRVLGGAEEKRVTAQRTPRGAGRAAIDMRGLDGKYKGAVGASIAAKRGLPEAVGSLRRDPLRCGVGVLRLHGPRLPRREKSIYPISDSKLNPAGCGEIKLRLEQVRLPRPQLYPCAER